jgi:hypothetical protein
MSIAKNPEIKPEVKRKRGNPNWHKGMASPNPIGRPRAGESRGEIWAEDWNATAEQIAEELRGTDLGRMFSQMPKGVPMYRLVGRRMLAAIMFEPQASVISLILDAIYGKVSEKLEHSLSFSVSIGDVEWKPATKNLPPMVIDNQVTTEQAATEQTATEVETSLTLPKSLPTSKE